MTEQPDKLFSLDDLMEIMLDPDIVDSYKRIAIQLSSTMRENKLLRNALGDLHSLYAETDRTLEHDEVCGRVQELLYGDTNKQSEIVECPSWCGLPENHGGNHAVVLTRDIGTKTLGKP